MGVTHGEAQEARSSKGEAQEEPHAEDGERTRRRGAHRTSREQYAEVTDASLRREVHRGMPNRSRGRSPRLHRVVAVHPIRNAERSNRILGHGSNDDVASVR